MVSAGVARYRVLGYRAAQCVRRGGDEGGRGHNRGGRRRRAGCERLLVVRGGEWRGGSGAGVRELRRCRGDAVRRGEVALVGDQALEQKRVGLCPCSIGICDLYHSL